MKFAPPIVICEKCPPQGMPLLVPVGGVCPYCKKPIAEHKQAGEPAE